MTSDVQLPYADTRVALELLTDRTAFQILCDEFRDVGAVVTVAGHQCQTVLSAMATTIRSSVRARTRSPRRHRCSRSAARRSAGG